MFFTVQEVLLFQRLQLLEAVFFSEIGVSYGGE
jgi:hypothetical protein